MSLPPFYEFCLPTLQELLVSPQGSTKRDVYERVAKRMKLTDGDLQDVIPSGQSVFENRVGWALSYMKKLGWVDNPSRAFWTVLPAGRERTKSGKAIGIEEIRPAKDEPLGPNTTTPQLALPQPTLTPQERIDAARAEISWRMWSRRCFSGSAACLPNGSST